MTAQRHKFRSWDVKKCLDKEKHIESSFAKELKKICTRKTSQYLLDLCLEYRLLVTIYVFRYIFVCIKIYVYIIFILNLCLLHSH